MIRQSIAVGLVASLLFAMSGCATLFASKQEVIYVSSNPPGAQIAVDGFAMGTTPAQISVDATRPHQIRLTMAGHAPIDCNIQTTIGIGWLILDFLFLFPLVVDFITEAWNHPVQTFCTANFGTPATGYPPAGPAPAPVPGTAPAPTGF